MAEVTNGIWVPIVQSWMMLESRFSAFLDALGIDVWIRRGESPEQTVQVDTALFDSKNLIDPFSVRGFRFTPADDERQQPCDVASVVDASVVGSSEFEADLLECGGHPESPVDLQPFGELLFQVPVTGRERAVDSLVATLPPDLIPIVVTPRAEQVVGKLFGPRDQFPDHLSQLRGGVDIFLPNAGQVGAEFRQRRVVNRPDEGLSLIHI